jgi:hypothetical protein
MSKDNWCTPLYREDKQPLFGGAARNVRIAASGGMEEIIKNVSEQAARTALQKANDLATHNKTISDTVASNDNVIRFRQSG